MKRTYLPVTLATLLVILAGCGMPPVENNATESPVVVGCLKKADGKSPAIGALVALVPGDAITGVDGFNKIKNMTVVATTAADGHYSFDACPPGRYVVEATDYNGNGIRIDSVVVESNAITDLREKTLRATGSMRGKVSLENAGDPSNVFVLVFGSDRFVQTGSDGNFQMNGLPYGTYRLKIVCILSNCGSCKTVQVTVPPGDTVTIDEIVLGSEPVGIPNKVAPLFDREKLFVRLSWEPCTGAEIKGYYIYKYDTGVTDLFSAEPDFRVEGAEVAGIIDSAPAINTTCTYAVAAVSKSGVTGMKSIPVTVSTFMEYDNCDTITMVEDNGWITHCNWTKGNKLMVTTTVRDLHAPDKYFITVLTEDLEMVSQREITCFMPNIVKITDEAIYWRMHTDSIVYCSNFDGSERYHVNVHHPVNSIKVYDDTFLVIVDMADGDRWIEMYEQGGALLYQDSAALRTYNFFGDEQGGFYRMENTARTPDLVELYRIDPVNRTKQFLLNFPLQEAYGSFEKMGTGYVSVRNEYITIFDTAMQIVSRFCQSSSLPDNSTDLQNMTINSHRRVAGIIDGKSVVAFNMQ